MTIFKKRLVRQEHLSFLLSGLIVGLFFGIKDFAEKGLLKTLIAIAFITGITWFVAVSFAWVAKLFGEKFGRKPEMPEIPDTWKPVVASIHKVSVFGVIVFFVLLVISGGFFHEMWSKDAIDVQMFYFFALLIGGIVLHELCHALGWMLTGQASYRDIRFGIMWNFLAPYAHCKIPLPMYAYQFGAFLPSVLTGVVPTIVGIMIADFTLMLVGVILTTGAIGDAVILWLTRGYDRNQMVMDHPAAMGFILVHEQTGDEESS